MRSTVARSLVTMMLACSILQTVAGQAGAVPGKLDTNFSGDGRATAFPKGATEELRQALREFPRQALHAARLKFEHPVSGRPLEFASVLPADLRALLDALAHDLAGA